MRAIRAHGHVRRRVGAHLAQLVRQVRVEWRPECAKQCHRALVSTSSGTFYFTK